MSESPHLEKQTEDDCKLEAGLGYIVETVKEKNKKGTKSEGIK